LPDTVPDVCARRNQPDDRALFAQASRSCTGFWSSIRSTEAVARILAERVRARVSVRRLFGVLQAENETARLKRVGRGRLYILATTASFLTCPFW
jgi:hypothetical protein